MTDSDDRRKTDRVPFAIHLTIHATGKEHYHDETRDIGMGGVFVITDDLLPIDAEGKFAIQLASGAPESVMINGSFKVASHTVKYGKQGMGITFTELEGDSSIELYRIVRYNQPDHG